MDLEDAPVARRAVQARDARASAERCCASLRADMNDATLQCYRRRWRGGGGGLGADGSGGVEGSGGSGCGGDAAALEEGDDRRLAPASGVWRKLEVLRKVVGLQHGTSHTRDFGTSQLRQLSARVG